MTGSARVNVSPTTALLAAIALIAAGATAAYLLTGREPAGAPAATPAASQPAPPSPSGPVTIPLDKARADRAGIVAAPVTMGPASGRLRIPAVVEPNAYQQVVVTPTAGGRVTRVLAELGQHVRRGQALAQVYSPELAEAQTRLIALRAEFDAAEREVNRTRRLVEIGAASRQELEKVHAEHAGHAAALAGARSRLVLLGMAPSRIDSLSEGSEVSATITVPAPLDGQITEREANPGLNVDPSTKLFTVVNLATVWVVGDAYERDFSRVSVGDGAVVTTQAYPGEALSGSVSYIDPQVNPGTRTARVRVELPNPAGRLRLGMLAEISLQPANGPAVLLVPREAVQTIGEQHVVYVVAEAGRYVERPVTIGARSGEMIEIVEGLRTGEVVVTTGSFHLRAEAERLGLRSRAPAAAGSPVTVSERGFEPSRVALTPGAPARLTFVRTTDATCATEVVFPELKIRQPLPLHQPVTVELPARDAGEVTFACGMDMVKGVAVFSR